MVVPPSHDRSDPRAPKPTAAPAQASLRVAIVDDHPMTRRGIEAILASQDGIEVVCSACSLGELARSGIWPDVVVLDLRLGGKRVTQAQIWAQVARQPVLAISGYSDRGDILDAIDAGASGYLTKDAASESLVTAVQTIAAGDFYLSPQLADLVDADLRQVPQRRRHLALSRQEGQTLRYTAQGLTTDQVAARLGIKRSTVETYIKRIHLKIGPGNKAHLASKAIELGYLDPGT
jgi:two-component system, NarL family, nitrate/nitrite response regulator NarL